MLSSGTDQGSGSRPSAHRLAYLGAYALLERVQGEDHLAAVEEAATALVEAERIGWSDVAFVLRSTQIVHQLGRVEPVVFAGLTAQLLADAETMVAPAFQAMALSLTALGAGGDAAQVIALTARAVALLDDDQLPGMSRAVGYVMAAAACNSLSLYELVDELYQRALRLEPACSDALQTEAIAVNRVLITTEWALALVENADPAADERFAEVLEAATVALARSLRPLWRAVVLACRDTVRLLGAGTATELRALLPVVRESMAGYRELLVQGDDVEGLPALDAALALAEFRAGIGPVQPLGRSRQSLSSGARTFPQWARAQLLAADLPSEVAIAQREYAEAVSRARWQSRGAVLAAARAQIATERRRSEHDRLRQAVETDVLTGLKNRRVFDRALQDCLGPVALLLIDVDGFKPINDTFGHDVGDEVLRRIGSLMRQSCRIGDLAIRQGGDEFALILQGETVTAALAADVARRLAALVDRQPWAEVADGLMVSVSVGLACTTIEPTALAPDDPQAASRALYRAADAALYESKRTGGPVAAATPTQLAS